MISLSCMMKSTSSCWSVLYFIYRTIYQGRAKKRSVWWGYPRWVAMVILHDQMTEIPLLIQVIPLDSSPWCNPFTALHAFWSACMGCERYVAPGCVGDSAYVFQLEREFIRPLFQSFYYIQLNIFTHFIRRYKDTILDILTYNLTWKKDIRRSEVI